MERGCNLQNAYSETVPSVAVTLLTSVSQERFKEFYMKIFSIAFVCMNVLSLQLMVTPARAFKESEARAFKADGGLRSKY